MKTLVHSIFHAVSLQMTELGPQTLGNSGGVIAEIRAEVGRVAPLPLASVSLAYPINGLLYQCSILV